MADGSVLQWFPGHMAKTRREITQDMRSVELVAVLLDARIPKSSSNPEIKKIIGAKPQLVLLNKVDLADPAVTAQWQKAFQAQQIPSLCVDCQSGRGLKEFPPLVREIMKEKIERDKARGMTKSIRIMVVGVPNVGKSSLINRMCGGKRAKVEDRPGVTRNKQWIRLPSGLELLDTPGVLWPKFEDEIVGQHLSFTGAIKDGIVDLEHVACQLLAELSQTYPDLLQERYKLEELYDHNGYELLQAVGKKRGFLISGGEIDTLRAAIMLLDEFRAAKIGRISLEKPE